ncbi:MAG: histidinol-phosphatase [Treponema sp.]|nr:histidinol-phosphatase [Treponema sp.]
MKTNYHTHTTFCDGKESAEAMAEAAKNLGFGILGFSSHAMYPFSDSWHIHIAPDGYEAYTSEISRLKEAYRGRLEILTGFEADYIPGLCKPDMEEYAKFKPDFIIGSVHYVLGDGGYFEADGPLEETRNRIARYFGGDVRRAIAAYYDSERRMLRESRFTILGHADLIRKQNSKGAEPLFDEDEDWYKAELEKTADAIAQAGVIVEINTGGMARGFLDSPYPSTYFLSLLKKRNVPVTINSDAHKSINLEFAFEQAKDAARQAGYTELAYLDKDGIKFQQMEAVSKVPGNVSP